MELLARGVNLSHNLQQGKFMRTQQQCNDFISHVYLILRVTFITCKNLQISDGNTHNHSSTLQLSDITELTVYGLYEDVPLATGYTLFSFPTLEQGFISGAELINFPPESQIIHYDPYFHKGVHIFFFYFLTGTWSTYLFAV